MADVSVTNVLLGAAALLGDPAQEQFTNPVLLPWFQTAYREAYDLVSRWGLPVGQRDAYFVVPANTTILYPSQVGITDVGEPKTLFERNQITQYAITVVSNTTPIQVTTSTPHNLSNGAPCEINGVTGVVGINGVEWRVTVVDGSNVTLNGSVAGGSGSTGTLISGGEESGNPFIEMLPASYLPQTPPDNLLHYWKWQEDTFFFNGAVNPVEVWIEYQSSGDPPSSGNVGWDNCQNFMQYRTAGLVAAQYDMPQTAATCNQLALGPSGEPDGTGGALRGFAQPMLKEKQKRPARAREFRPRRNRAGRGYYW